MVLLNKQLLFGFLTFEKYFKSQESVIEKCEKNGSQLRTIFN